MKGEQQTQKVNLETMSAQHLAEPEALDSGLVEPNTSVEPVEPNEFTIENNYPGDLLERMSRRGY